MTGRERCETVQGRLSEATLARRRAAAADLEHAERCEACGRHEQALVRIGVGLAAEAALAASDALVEVTLLRARSELARRDAARAEPLAGWRREVGRSLGIALLPLPLVLLWNAAVLTLGGELLAGILPGALLHALAVGYGVAGVTWLACVYGSVPVLAHRQLYHRALATP